MASARQRILFLNHVSEISGAERSLLDAVRHLDRGRFEPFAAVPRGGELPELLAQADVRVRAVPLRRMRKTANPVRLAGDLLNVAGVAAQLAGIIRRDRIALVHANSNTAQIYGGPAARLCGIPCVWHTRDLVGLGPFGRWLARTSDCTIAISQCVRRHVAPWVRGPDKVRAIYNGIDTARFAPRGVRPRVRAALGLPPEAPVLGMVAQMAPWKGHGAFIEAAARIAAARPDVRFVMAGADLFNDHPDYVAGLQAKIAELGMTRTILLVGYTADAAALMESMDVLIHPAHREPLGRVILEAMAMGKPVVAVNACGPAEIIRSGVDGILTATGAPEELADAALGLIGDRLLAGRIGAAARLRVQEAFDIRVTVREIESVYDDLLRERGARCA